MPGKGFDAPYGYVELRGVSYNDDDRHVVETATNRIFQDHRSKGTCVLSVQKNFTVINQLGCQLIWVGGERNVHGSISAKRDWKRWMVMTVSNIEPVMAKFN